MMLFQQQEVDESMSNLTSASGEASGSSGGNKAPEFPHNFTPSTSQQQQPPPPNKKKRNLPGNPDPEAEVIALSPKTLMATNRFVCEICNKGFQRDQNLQLHRRGHNLPWKLKQRPSKEAVRKKVYVCPEAGCVHHDPARALGDLTGIKKHFSRKHGEKRWKCDKCSKRYAVQSDWKAHSKTCGTREYRCDCGTIFSRRDSFITHRAFCDALAEETARSAVANPTPLQLPLPSPSPSPSHQHHLNQFLTNTINLHMLDNNNNNNLHNSMQLKKEQQTSFVSSSSSPLMPPWLGPHAPPSFDHQLFSNSVVQDFSDRNCAPNPNPSQTTAAPQLPAFQLPPPPLAHMSATALLQKAAQMGATMSGGASAEAENDAPRQQSVADPRLARHRHRHRDLNLSSPSSAAAATNDNNSIVLRDAVMMGSLRSSDSAEAGFGGFLRPQDHVIGFSGKAEARDASIAAGTGNNGGDQAGLTRDFLGLRALSHSDILSLAGLGNSINISRDHQNNNQPHHKPW